MSALPFEYHAGFLELLASRPDVFNTITYADLPWGDDDDYRAGYRDEWRAWLAGLAESGDDRMHVLIQHDVDGSPERTMAQVELELQLGLRSNVMVHAHCFDRIALREGRKEEVPYELDIELLKRAEQAGCVIGYHSNCVEQALWDLDAAPEYFSADVAELRQHFDIRHFSPHGGVPGPNGVNNVDMILPDELTRDVRWVHNKYAPSFNGRFSDGGLLTREAADRDLRPFVRGLERGKRYRVLTHPQYYWSPPAREDTLEAASWGREIYDRYEQGDRDFWSDSLPDVLRREDGVAETA